MLPVLSTIPKRQDSGSSTSSGKRRIPTTYLCCTALAIFCVYSVSFPPILTRRDEAAGSSDAISHTSVFQSSADGFDYRDGDESDKQLLDTVVNHVRANGDFINEKIEVRSINDNLSGIFANDTIQNGEILWHVRPRNIIRGSDFCDTVQKVYAILETNYTATLNPYERYLATRSRTNHPLPAFWSKQGVALLEKLLSGAWEIERYMHLIQSWMNRCDRHRQFDSVDMVGNQLRTAIVIATVRTEHDDRDLVPFHDLINHARGHADNALCSRTSEGYMVRAKGHIQKGEQVAFSYSISTIRLFLRYGFLEDFPQKWRSRSLGLEFHVEKNHTRLYHQGPSLDWKSFLFHEDSPSGLGAGEWIEVRFEEPPSPATVQTIREELERVVSFGSVLAVHKQGGGDLSADSRIPIYELDAIIGLHSALVVALKRAERASSGLVSARNHVYPQLGQG